jgi:hypothetical protein
MGERSYHGAMMNVQPKYPNGRVRMDCSMEYKEGHRDARHACADIANDADAEIAALRERVTGIVTRAEKLEAFVMYVHEYSNDPAIVAQARALLGEGGEG